MPWKEIVGARFSPAEFDDYVAQLDFSAWRPQFVVVHNTGIPALADRPAGYNQAQMQNLVHYYRDTKGWSAGPHCFVDQNGIWVFTPLTTSGVHSPSWNGVSWGIETLGDYSTEAFTDPIHEHLVACLATLHAVVPLDVSNLHFHKEDPLTTHICPGVNLNKVALIHDVRALMASRSALSNPASGRYPSDSLADLAPQSHFFVDHTAVDVQTNDITYGPVSTGPPADKENKFRVTSLFKASADVKAYAAVAGTVMLQRVSDEANPGAYLPDVVNLVIKPYKQPMPGFTPVKYFIYRNLRLDNFLMGGSAADEKFVRAEAGASAFIQNQWAIHTAWNSAAPFESVKLGYDPANQSGSAEIEGLFHRQNPYEQLPFVARGDHIGDFRANAGADGFGIEIILEGDFQPGYDYVRKYNEVIIDVSGMPSGTAQEKFSLRLRREQVLNYIDPAAFFGLHMNTGGWLQVKDGTGNKKLTGLGVYDNVITKFATRDTLYVDIRNENGFSLNFYNEYDDGSGNALEVGATSASLIAQPYASNKWPLIIRTLVAEPNTNDYNQVFLRLRRGYNNRPIVYLEHGQPDGRTTRGRFIADTDLIGATDPTTNVIGFRYPNKDLGGGSRIGVAWLLKIDYTMRLDAANSPFPASVVSTESYVDNLFGPLDLKPPWAVSSPVIVWMTAPDKKYIDGSSLHGLGFEHIAERGVAFSKWTASSSTVGNVIFFAAAKDTFVNNNKNLVSPISLASGVSKRDSFFDEVMLFDGYSADFNVIKDGSDDVPVLKLTEAQPRPRPPEAMMLVGLTGDELENHLKPLSGFDNRYPRNLLLQELAGSPFTDAHGTNYRKYKIGVRGMSNQGTPHDAFPIVDVITYTLDRKSFCSRAFTQAQPPPQVQERNYEEKWGETVRLGDTYAVASASGAAVTITAPTTQPPVEIKREIVPGDMVTVKSEIYNVINVAPTAGGAVVTLDATPPGLIAGTDTLRAPNKNLEDYFIAKDQLGVLSGINRMGVLVADFIAGVSVIPDDTTAPAMIETLVNDYGPKILQRARLICSDSNFAYADDRILYWARIKMMVKMKNHSYLARIKTKQDELVRLFETQSRGFEGISFAGAVGCKVLITGFDPFQIDLNNNCSNPSGAAALALSGPQVVNGVSIHIQSAVFPNRYADFDGTQSPAGGTPVVESFFEKFIDPAIPGTKPDMIVTLSQTPLVEFLLERFACRTRSGYPDNMTVRSSTFPSTVEGDEFYETTLDEAKIVPTNNIQGRFKLFYNNYFWYEWTASGITMKAFYGINMSPLGLLPQPDSGHTKIEDADPNHLLSGMVPSMLSDITAPKLAEIKSKWGSGGTYFSNEIFYRVARLRQIHKPPNGPLMSTGHLHLPKMQHEKGKLALHSAADPTLESTEDMHPGHLKLLIEEILRVLVKACS